MTLSAPVKELSMELVAAEIIAVQIWCNSLFGIGDTLLFL